MLGAAMGLPVAFVMPGNVTQARKDIATAFGTELIFSDPMEGGTDAAIRLAVDLSSRHPEKYFYADQYSNPSNPLAHYDGTGKPDIESWLGGTLYAGRCDREHSTPHGRASTCRKI